MIKKIAAIILILIATVGLVLFAPEFSLTIGQVPKAETLKVKAQDLKLVCPGGVYRTSGLSSAKLGAFESAGSPVINSDFNGPPGTSIIASNNALTVSDPAGIATQNSILLNANQVQSVSIGNMAGLSATACQRPTNAFWFIGGDTSTGRESLLVLKNATTVDATVSLEIFNERGKMNGVGLSGISVAAGKTTVIPLASFAPKTKTFTTHVVSHGGLIAAWVQQKTIRALASGGIDYVPPAATFGRTQVIPGIFIRGTADAAKFRGKPDYDDLVPTLRVFVPGNKPATVTAQVIGATSKTFGTVIRQTVAAGATTDIQLTGLSDGDFIALIEADVPVGASVRLHRVAKTKVDFSWLTSATAQTGEVGFSVPSAGISKLSLANPSSKEINFNLSQGGGVISTLTIPATGQLVLTFAPNSKLKLSANGKPIFGTLIVDVGGSVGAIPLVDYKNSSGEVAVMVR